MASFLKRLFGGADKLHAAVAPDSPSVVAEPITAIADEPAPAAATDRVPTTKSMTDIFAQKQVEFESSEAATGLREETGAELLRRKLAAMQDESAEQLKDWTCSKCGAALPQRAEDCSTITCTYCVSAFHAPRPKRISGGVNISAGMITVGGDIVGGDRIVVVSEG